MFLPELRKQVGESVRTAITIGVWWLIRSRTEIDTPSFSVDPTGAVLGLVLELALVVAAVLIVAIIYAVWSGRPTLDLSWKLGQHEVDAPKIHFQVSDYEPSGWYTLVLNYRVVWALRWLGRNVAGLPERKGVLSIQPPGYVDITCERDPTARSSVVESGVKFDLRELDGTALLSVVRIEVVPNLLTDGVPLTVSFDVEPGLRMWERLTVRRICKVNSLLIDER